MSGELVASQGSPDTKPGPVLVLAGGLSHERDVSLRSGRRVSEALRGSGLEVVERDVDSSLLGYLRRERPSCVVPMLHGETGEDGLFSVEHAECIGACGGARAWRRAAVG